MRLDAMIPMEQKEADAIARAISCDRDSKRSRTSFSPCEEGLNINIEADDAVAMRAAINSHLRLVDSCLKTIKVIQNA